MEELDEVGIHELVVVGNVEDVDLFVGEFLAEGGEHARLVLFLHDQDEIGPADVTDSQSAPGLAAGAGGLDGDAWFVAPDTLSRRAAPLIAAADEQDV